jgi:pyruvate kinase
VDPQPGQQGLDTLLQEMDDLREFVRAAPLQVDVNTIHPAHRDGVDNLARFVALRSQDLRGLQDDLAVHGLSSLGRAESHVLATLDAVINALRALCGAPPTTSDQPDPAFSIGPESLARSTDALLGPVPDGRSTRIMVTLPSDAADDPDLVERLVQAGMDVARINCAHDDATRWRAMAEHVRAAAVHHGRDVRVLMDLAGPKLRTGRMVPGPAVVKVKPRRDLLGRVLQPGVAALVPSDRPSGDAEGLPRIPVNREFFDRLHEGMGLTLTDSRGATRQFQVVSTGRQTSSVRPEVEVTSPRTAYVTTGTTIETDHPSAASGVVAALPPAPGFLRVSIGTQVDLVGADLPGEELTADRVRLGCTLPVAVASLRPGDRVFFDDGAFGGIVHSVTTNPAGTPTANIRITSAPPGGGKLRAEKGINLPDTHVPVPALTDDDLADLDTAVRLADMVALSFVRDADDVAMLLDELGRRDARHLGVVMKIETVHGFRQLPAILRAAMRNERVGVMIARGDLAVEAGYERLAEVQEEILWLCEAAHLPVIWATEVLDNLARTGRPSRSEITDAAMSERAECVMLNKGPHIIDAVLTLHDILHRMAEHQRKKRPLLRPLRSWMPDGPA